jgi:hypothetical protein
MKAGAKRATEGDVGGTAEAHAVTGTAASGQQPAHTRREEPQAAPAIGWAHTNTTAQRLAAASAGVAVSAEGEDDVAGLALPSSTLEESGRRAH